MMIERIREDLAQFVPRVRPIFRSIVQACMLDPVINVEEAIHAPTKRVRPNAIATARVRIP
jgi:hypothetical protein